VTVLVDTSVLTGTAAIDIEEPFAVSAISIGELELGVLLASDAPTRAARLGRLTALLAAAPVVTVDESVASSYAVLRATTSRQPTNDLWIAATAVAHGIALVTGDERQAKLPGVDARLVAT
jgi:predicted nucleic acid-binding protein